MFLKDQMHKNISLACFQKLLQSLYVYSFVYHGVEKGSFSQEHFIESLHFSANSLLFKECILLASTALKEGEVIALATDTVYGIAALAQSTSAVQKLYQIKGRNFEKPIAISVGRISDVNKYVMTVLFFTFKIGMLCFLKIVHRLSNSM